MNSEYYIGSAWILLTVFVLKNAFISDSLSMIFGKAKDYKWSNTIKMRIIKNKKKISFFFFILSDVVGWQRGIRKPQDKYPPQNIKYTRTLFLFSKTDTECETKYEFLTVF